MADFDAPLLTLVALAEITLPTKTLRLCDGGYVYKDAEKYASSDDEFGSVRDVDAIEERTGDEAPGGRLTFLPISTASAAVLSQPTFQGSSLRFYLGRVNETTGTLDGDPEMLFDGELDTTTLRIGRGSRALDMQFVAKDQLLFNINEGNVLSDRFHQSLHPGELGMANATGITSAVAWGTESPPRATVAGSGSGSIGQPWGRRGLLDNVAMV